MNEKTTNNTSSKEMPENLIYQSPKVLVGIGASAGGLHALQELVTNLPSDVGASYIILQHLSPDFKSYMDELLKTYSLMPVNMAYDCQEIEENNIYLLPERKNLSVADGKILLSDIPEEANHRPIDSFFKSLAEEYQNFGVGIVLSGTGNDGSQGLIELHKVTALTIAQRPDSAEFSGMPENAILTGAVDHVLAPREMGKVIRKFVIQRKTQMMNMSDQDDDFDEQCEMIFKLVDQDSQVDFRDYKLSTVKRRMINRMGILDISSISEYLDYLNRDNLEKKALFNDLLIGVTQFYRDPNVWSQLTEQAIKKIIIEKPKDQDIRIWVPACSSGEEAYTLSILFKEAMYQLNTYRRLRIFASDIDKGSLNLASSGKYERKIVDDLPPHILEKYFHGDKSSYVIDESIRSQVIFAAHNILRDPPFSRMDLISCRNLLIYFRSPAQRKILSYFHFSLVSNGYLLLGTAETCSIMPEYFKSIDSDIKLFQKVGTRKISLSEAGFKSNLEKTKPLYQITKSPAIDSNLDIYHITFIKERLTRRFFPPTLVLDQESNIIYSFNNTELFTNKLKPGSNSLHYSNLVIDALIPALASLTKRLSVNEKFIKLQKVSIPESESLYTIEGNYIEMQAPKASHFYCISFISDQHYEHIRPSKGVKPLDSYMQDRIVELDDALSDARTLINERQQDVEAITEELRSSNEELMASNEELQSTNEELQSVNEELFTVNTEYQDKIKELELVNNDLSNILRFTDAGVVYLNVDLLIRRFTPKTTEYIKILPLDINRSIMDLQLTFECERLFGWIDKCRAQKSKVTRIVESDKRHIEIVINPCFDNSGGLDGYILLFRDIPIVQ